MNFVSFFLFSALVLFQIFTYRKINKKLAPMLPGRVSYPTSKPTRLFGRAKPILYALGGMHLALVNFVSHREGPGKMALLLGAFLSLLGLLLLKLSLQALGENFAPCNEAKLPEKRVKHGPYRFLNHPIYWSNTLLLGGLLLANPGPIGFAVYGLLLLFYYFSAMDENRALRSLEK